MFRKNSTNKPNALNRKKSIFLRIPFVSSLFLILVGLNICNAQTTINTYVVLSLNTSYEGALAVLPLIESKCYEDYGEGSKFSGHPQLSGEEFNEETQSFEKKYDVAVYCNGCAGSVFEEKKNRTKEECYAKCLKPFDVQCFSQGWGAYDNNTLKCSDKIDYSLPGCTESTSSASIEQSSSSDTEQFSSSEPSSSSSLASSSSMEESSSSEDMSDSSSSEETDSSSSDDEDDSSSSEGNCGEGGDHCGGSSGSGGGGAYCQINDDNWETLSRLPNIHRDIYFEAPYMINRDYAYLQNCYCTGTRAVACDFANFGLVQGYEPVSMPLCGLREGYWCRGISDGACDYTGVTTRIYYSDSPESVGFSWGAANFDNSGSVLPIETDWQTVFLNHNGIISHQFSIRHLLPTNVLYYDLENMVHEALPAFPDMNKLVAYCMGEWVPHDEDCFGTESEVNVALQDSSDKCAISYGIPHYETDLSSRGWCVVGECEAAEPYSSAEELSSSSEASSSSEGKSSSYESSSSQEPSSSSEAISEPFIAGPNQEYSPDQIFDSGLQNMEENACYSLNSERGTQYGWINTNAQDSWWWRKVPCDGSSNVVESTSNGCVENKRGVNAVYLPSDCFNSGLDNMEKGKCYSLNPDRGTQYGWINNNAQDSWWWIETPCEKNYSDENESEELVCPDDGNALFKRAAEYASFNAYDEYVGLVALPNYYYDALGRKMDYQKAFHVKQRVYSKNLIEKEYQHNRIGRIRYKALLKTVSGYVEADTELGFDNISYSCSSTGTVISVDLYMRTPKESIVMMLESSNQALVEHETKHKEIFEKYGTKYWYGKRLVLRKSIKESDICATVKNSFWPVVENEYRSLLNRQNAWDNEDEKNRSHDRINVEKAVADQKTIWFSQSCQKL